MKIIFCYDPLSEHNPDSMYIDEVAAATHAGLDFMLINYDALTQQGNAARAVRDIPVHDVIEPAIYRGWMLNAAQYAALYDALLSRGVQLINTAQQYQHTHHLPESLPIIESRTPRTVWMETDGRISYPAVMQLLLPFAGQPLILKDFVKSEKHYWNQACYIPSSSDEGAVKKTVEEFLKLRGDQLEGGLVFREFVEFERLDDHPASGMPLIQEYRIFYLDHTPIAMVRYWDVEGYEETPNLNFDQFKPIAARVRSRFFTMDVAQRTDGDWMIIELGDGQVAGLPTDIDLDAFYKALADAD